MNFVRRLIACVVTASIIIAAPSTCKQPQATYQRHTAVRKLRCDFTEIAAGCTHRLTQLRYNTIVYMHTINSINLSETPVDNQWVLAYMYSTVLTQTRQALSWKQKTNLRKVPFLNRFRAFLDWF